MPMFTYLDVAYGHLDAHTLDLYVPDEQAYDKPLIVFIHGGAWRDEDKSNHAELVSRIALSTACPVAIPNYRLTPRDPQHTRTNDPDYTRHPSHAQDVLAALTFLHTHSRGHKQLNLETSNDEPTQQPTPISSLPVPITAPSLHLIGHSCGAHILSSIFLSSAQITPSLTPSTELLAAVHSITMSEGIYDLDALIDSFPAYDEWFVKNAFDAEEGSVKKYARYATTSYPLHKEGTHIYWHVLHSRADSLVDLKQYEAMSIHLRKLHDSIELGQGRTMIICDADSLTQEHNEMLAGEAYSDLVSKYIRKRFT